MAVFTPVSAADITAWLRAYDVGDYTAHTGIAEGVENTNYKLITTGGTFILTIFEKRVQAQDLPFFMAAMQHLAHQNIPCPLPIAARHGAFINTLKNKNACLVSFLSGRWRNHSEPPHAYAVGKMLAQLHMAGDTFSMMRPNNLSLRGWETLADACSARANEVAPNLQKMIQDEMGFVQQHWPRHLPHGLIHADLFPDNVLFTNDSLTGVIDFYFACTDFWAYDLAITLNAWCFDAQHQPRRDMFQAMLAGYQSVRTLTPDEQSSLPILLRGAALRFLLTRLYDKLFPAAEAQVSEKNPCEYLEKLQWWQNNSTSIQI